MKDLGDTNENFKEAITVFMKDLGDTNENFKGRYWLRYEGKVIPMKSECKNLSKAIRKVLKNIIGYFEYFL